MNSIRNNHAILLVSALIFLFPIAGVSVRHWYSGIAVLLVLFGIYFFVRDLIVDAKRIKELSNTEILLIALVASLFVSYVISGFVNGWDSSELDYFLGEMNFLFFAPLYYSIRKINKSQELIIKGTVLAGPVLLVQFIHDVYISPTPSVTMQGVYSHLLSGPVAVMVFFITLTSFKYFLNYKPWMLLSIFTLIASFIAAASTDAGSAYALMVAAFLIVPPFMSRKKSRIFMIYAFLFVSLIVSFGMSSKVRYGVHRLTGSLELFLNTKDIADHPKSLGTVGDRLAMWKSSWNIFKSNVVFGVGRGNYNKYVKKEYHKGEINKDAVNYSHPHNMYLVVLVSKGIVGVVIFLSLLVLILKIFYQTYVRKVTYSDVALVFIILIMLVGLGSEGPLIKNNFVAIFFVYLAVFYSGQLKNINKMFGNGDIEKKL